MQSLNPQTWIKHRSHEEQKRLFEFASKIFPGILKFVTQEVAIRMPFLEAFYVSQFCSVFTAIVPQDGRTLPTLEMSFLFALAWSFGALLERTDRVRFDENLRNAAEYGKLALPPPTVSDRPVTLFDYKIDFKLGQFAYLGLSFQPGLT